MQLIFFCSELAKIKAPLYVSFLPYMCLSAVTNERTGNIANYIYGETILLLALKCRAFHF